MQPISTSMRPNPRRGAESSRVLAFGSTLRRGSAALQSVMILAVAMTVLLGILRIWSGDNGSGGMKDEVQDRVELVLDGGQDSDRSDSTDQSGNPDVTDPQGEDGTAGDEGGEGDEGEEQDPDDAESDGVSEQDRQRIAQLRADARRLNGLSNLAKLAGQKKIAETYKALSDAALLEVAHIRGPEFLKTEIAAIASARTVEATAEAFLKAIEKRVPITTFVTLPIVDGLGQLTGDFVRWWRSNQ